MLDTVECGFIYQRQNNILGRIRNEVVTLGEREQHAEQVWVEARACYLDWRKQEDEQSAFSFRRTVLRRDYRKVFDEASESSERIPSYDLSTLSDGSLRKRTDDLNMARSSFKDRLSQDSDVRHSTMTAWRH
jgi:hypothetical protein